MSLLLLVLIPGDDGEDDNDDDDDDDDDDAVLNLRLRERQQEAREGTRCYYVMMRRKVWVKSNFRERRLFVHIKKFSFSFT